MATTCSITVRYSEICRVPYCLGVLEHCPIPRFLSSACEHDTYSTLRTALDVEAGEYLDILISPSQTNICDNACAHFHNHITRKPRRSPSHPHPSTRSIPLLRHHLRCLDIGSSATDISRRITTGTTRSSHSMPHRRHNLHLLLHLHLPTHKRR